MHILPLIFSAVYKARLFWCELASVGDIDCRDVCLLSNIMELKDTWLVLKAPKHCIRDGSTAMSRSRIHDPLTQDKPWTFVVYKLM